MEDFDFNIDNEFGTSITKLKENNTNHQENIRFSEPILESDIDYDKIIENLNNSDTFVPKQNNNNIDVKYLVKNIENNLDNFNNINNNPRYNSIPFYQNNTQPLNFNENFNNEPLPSNFTKNMLPKKNNIPNYNNQKYIIKNNTNHKFYEKYLKCEYIDLIIYGILFILFNNKIIIELINKILKIQNDYANLLLRTIIFVVIIYLIKKYNL